MKKNFKSSYLFCLFFALLYANTVWSRTMNCNAKIAEIDAAYKIITIRAQGDGQDDLTYYVNNIQLSNATNSHNTKGSAPINFKSLQQIKGVAIGQQSLTTWNITYAGSDPDGDMLWNIAYTEKSTTTKKELANGVAKYACQCTKDSEGSCAIS